MKKTAIRIISLSLTLVFCLLAFAACGGGPLGKKTPDFDEIYKATPLSETAGGYTSHKVITAMTGATEVVGDGVLVSYKSREGILSVYNTELDRVVLTLPESATATSEISLHSDLIRVLTVENGAKQTTVYSKTGELLASAAGSKAIDAVDDGFIFEDKLYKVEEGALVKTFTIPPFVNLEGDYSESYRFAGDYLIHVKEHDSVVYYNEAFEAVARYQIPSDGISRYDITVLKSGKLFVWYERHCDNLSSDYDYHVTDYYGAQQKVRLFAEVFDPVKEKTKAVDLDGIRVSDVWKEEDLEDYDCFTEDVTNILEYQKVVEGNVDYARSYFVALDADGELGVSLDAFFEGQTGLILPLNSSYYYAKTATGYAVLDTAGTVLRELPAMGQAKEYGYLYKNKIYDHNFDLAVNLDAPDIYYLKKDYDAAALYCRRIDAKDQYYIYHKNGEHLVVAPEGYKIQGEFYAVTLTENFYYARLEKAGGDTLSYYGYYALDGTLLFQIKGATANFITDCLVSYQNMQGEAVFALLS